MIDLQKPIRSERVRGFQPPWYTIYVYKCELCGREIRIKWQGGPGGVRCTCEDSSDKAY